MARRNRQTLQTSLLDDRLHNANQGLAALAIASAFMLATYHGKISGVRVHRKLRIIFIAARLFATLR